MATSASKRVMPPMKEETKIKIRKANLKTWLDPELLKKHSQKTKKRINNMSPEKIKKWKENSLKASRSKKNRKRARIQMLKMREDPNFLKKAADGRAKAFKGSGNPFYGYKHTEKTRIAISKTKKESDTTIRGEKSNAFIDGKGQERRVERRTFMESLEYRLFRERSFKRDNFTCVHCGSKKQLQVHHIKSYQYYPKLRTKVINGMTLCKTCHRKTDNYGRKKK